MLTRRQQQLYSYITSYIGERGASPSFDEMAKAMALPKGGALVGLLAQLQSRGKIEYRPYTPRGVRLIVHRSERSRMRYLPVVWDVQNARQTVLA